jgi:hypothetical protein
MWRRNVKGMHCVTLLSVSYNTIYRRTNCWVFIATMVTRTRQIVTLYLHFLFCSLFVFCVPVNISYDMWEKLCSVEVRVFLIYCTVDETKLKECALTCGPVPTACPSFLLTSKGLHIPHLSKPRTNDKWWRDCVGSRSCISHVGCWKGGGRELCTREWSQANQPPAIYTIHPLYEGRPLTISSITILNPGALVVLVLWKVSKRQAVEQAPRGPFSQTGTNWTVTDYHTDFQIAPTARYLNTGTHATEVCYYE